MINKSINYLHIAGSGLTIDKFGDELNSHDIKYHRSPRCFSPGTVEFVEIATPIATSVLSLITGIIVARFQNRKIRVKLKNHPHVEEIEVGSLSDFKNVMKEIDEMYLD
ncbi:hypothetical protein OGV58_07005 [Citrobacter sp. Cf097]|uniref:hypothetical protein n=1 Tax=Citrobacter TaxID=544 RepID=UPI0024E09928|nr:MULTISPECIES: hypothetical protein [Citrobacter]MDM3201762.1 hypothetical protein [Citrobacter sp. Cf097]WOR51266.1 hypothetical protein R4T09_06710 [Citrobacter freundii]